MIFVGPAQTQHIDDLVDLERSAHFRALAARDPYRPVLTSLLSFTIPETLAAIGASHSDFAFDGAVDRDRSDCRRVWINLGVARGRILDGRSVHVE